MKKDIAPMTKGTTLTSRILSAFTPGVMQPVKKKSLRDRPLWYP